MTPLFDDPATLKVVMGKFLLATNDPSNPVRSVRQIANNGSTGDVVVTLQSGETYTDSFTDVTDLLSITSNQAWDVTISLDFTISTTIDSVDSAEIFAADLFNCLDSVRNAVTHTNFPKYLPEHQLVPRRITCKSIQLDCTLTGRVRHDYSEPLPHIHSKDECLSVTYTVISPPDVINDITEDLMERVETALRTYGRSRGHVIVSGRNVSGRNTIQADMAAAIELIRRPPPKPQRKVSICTEVDEKEKHYAILSTQTMLTASKALLAPYFKEMSNRESA